VLLNGKGTLMRHDCKTLIILFAPHTMQVSVLDISTHLSCVAAPIRPKVDRVSAKYLYSLAAIVCYLIFLK
jgi:hypothetical protein